MTVVRALARPLLSVVFLAQGASAIRNPEPLVPKAQPVTDRLMPLVKRAAPAPVVERLPETTANLVRLNGAAQVVGGLALASGKGRRFGAALLAATLVPTTLAAYPFWQESDRDDKREQREHFMKNLGLLGGLMLATVDTEGRPGLAWRATHGAQVAKRETRRGAKAARRETTRGAKLAKREAAQFAKNARREAKATARVAKAELPFG